MPPVAVSIVLYAAFSVPAGSGEVVVIVSGGGAAVIVIVSDLVSDC